MIKNNDAETSLGFYDVNVQPKEMDDTDKTLVFDLTSGNTVVQDIDLAFETPNSALSSMIAIGNQSIPEVYDQFELLRFNMLNNLQSDQQSSATNQFYKVRHLPFFGEPVEIVDKQDRKITTLDQNISEKLDGSNPRSCFC